ncbi:MAG: nitrate reductase [Deltaproteobacteria bacterium]|nr:nitrate reductase [Deltaproteobacteria bacterium]
MRMTRREMIKLSAAAFAAGALNIPFADSAEAQGDDVVVDEWIKGACRFCGTGCGVYIGVRGGKVVGIRGNPEALTNFGFLCVKGFKGFLSMYHPDRLKYPMVRQADGKLTRVSWNEALGLVANKFKELQSKYGKDSVAYYGSGQCMTEESYTFNKLWKGGFRSNMVDGNPRLCMASAVGGYMTTFGTDEPAGSYSDIEKAKTFFIVGSNLSECHPIIFRRIARMKLEAPDKINVIVCEPRYTSTSRIADVWLPADPGTDLAVFHCMAREIIKNGWIDSFFVNNLCRFTTGQQVVDFEAYKQFLEQFKPEDVSKLTRVPVANIVEAARLFATQGPTVSLWTMGLNQRTRGVWANNLIHNLHLITGHICKDGADSFSLTGQPNACGGVRETGSLCHLLPGTRLITNEAARTQVEKAWGIPAKSIDPKPGFHTMQMFAALGAENDATKPLKGMLITTTNPAQSLPNAHKYFKGMEEAFLVVIDIFPTRTTQFADVLLPAAFIYEKGGVYGCSERRSQLTGKCVEPPGEAKPDLWIGAQLAKRMGFEKLIPWNGDDPAKNYQMAWDDYRTCVKDTEHTVYGMTYERLKKLEAGLQWPCPTPEHPGTAKRYVRGQDPIMDMPHIEKVPPQAMIYFYADTKHEGKANVFLRPYKGPEEPPDKDYPFFLTTGRVIEQWHSGTMTMRVPEIARSQPNAYVEVHPNDAKQYGLNNGDMVKVISRRGFMVLPARVVKMSLPGILFIPWFDQAWDRMVNRVTIDAVDEGSRQPEFKICAVKIERVGDPRDVAEMTIISNVNDPFPIKV